MEDKTKLEKKAYVIFLFPSSHVAIKAELASKKAFPSSRLIPLPPEVSAGCGMVLRAEIEQKDAMLACLKEANVEVEDLYKLELLGGKRNVEKLN